jgi:hypothetical protein
MGMPKITHIIEEREDNARDAFRAGRAWAGVTFLQSLLQKYRPPKPNNERKNDDDKRDDPLRKR